MAKRLSSEARQWAAALGLTAGAAVCFALPFGCGSDAEESTSPLDDGGDAATSDGPTKQETVTLHPDATPLPGESSCEVVMTTGIAIAQAHHVSQCSSVDYRTNPPSGGDHWPPPFWATYQKHAEVVPREMLVHNLEH